MFLFKFYSGSFISRVGYRHVKSLLIVLTHFISVVSQVRVKYSKDSALSSLKLYRSSAGRIGTLSRETVDKI